MPEIITGKYSFRAQTVIYGPGTVTRVSEQADKLGSQRAFIVTIPPLITNTDLVNKVIAALGKKYAGTYSNVVQHVPRRCVIEGAKAVKEAGADLLISIGGSSVADAAKLMALALSETDSIDDFFRKYDSSESISAGRFDKPKLPLIAIPTTLAGAEYTGSAGVTNEVRHFKDTFRHASLTPRLVILDPETTIYTGKNLWSSTALKILADCFEACYSPQHQPVIDAMALHAARLINENLLASIEEPMNLGARALLQHASWMIAYGGWGSSVGMIGSLRHQIGAMHNVEHGIASTIVFPNGVEGNRPDIDDRLRLMAPSFNIIAGTKDAPGAVIERVRELIVKSGLPTKLRDVGIPEDALSAIAEASMKGAWVKNAPKPVTMDMLLTVLKKSW